MDFEQEYTDLHFNEDRIKEPIFYIEFKIRKTLGIITDREVKGFGAVEDEKDVRTIWTLETFNNTSDFYKRIQKYLPMVVTL